jgi:hypothetical protein
MHLFRAPHPLGGGLNNQVLHLTQLLTDTCARNGTLELPRFMAGEDFFRHRGDPYSNYSIAFSDIFDEETFRESIRPCMATKQSSANATIATLTQINANWFRDAKRLAMVPNVYAALKPGRRVHGPLTRALRAIDIASSGPWAAVHLRIERDWNVFCDKRFRPRRCFTQNEIGEITHTSLSTASATVLLYSHDLLPAHIKPRLVRNAFCGRIIELPRATGVYVIQAAVQLFVAANASHSFHGNSYSTFSRGVALLRRGVNSFSYDCAGNHVRKGTGLNTLNQGQCTKNALRVSGATGSICNQPEDCRCVHSNKQERNTGFQNKTATQDK